MQNRYSELDAIRGIAALMVVFYHYTVRYGEIYGYQTPPLFTFEPGQYGVHLFFIVSGFVIFLTLNRTRYTADFVVSRFSRLYPAYWISVALTFIIVSVFSLPGREIEPVSALLNLTMFQQWIQVPHVDGVYWSLTVEICFYVLLGLLFSAGLLNKIYPISLFWLLLMLLAHTLEKNAIIVIHPAIKLLFLLDYAHLFIAGIVFYKLHESASDKPLWNYGLLLLALFTEYSMNGQTVWLIGIYFLLFLLFVFDKLFFLSTRPLVFLGSISYGLYLLHQNIGYVIIREMESLQISNPLLIILAPLLASIILATLIRKYIETPSLAYIRSRWKNSQLREHMARRSHYRKDRSRSGIS